MSQPLATTSTRVPTRPDRDGADQADRRREPGRSRLWTLIEALASAGAYIDPSGILAVQRMRQAQEDEEHDARR
jgi:hypothetical protein